MIYSMSMGSLRETFALLKQDLVRCNTTTIYRPKRKKLKGYQKNRK